LTSHTDKVSGHYVIKNKMEEKGPL